jgi:hypothetical protein
MATNLARKADAAPRATARLATKGARRRLSFRIVGAQSQRESVRFFALDASMRVEVEADSEDDARVLCREMEWEFLGCSDG